MVFVIGYMLMWQMKSGDDKCKVLHAGKMNPNHAFTLIGLNCTIITHIRALGVFAESSQKQQCSTCLEAARQTEC